MSADVAAAVPSGASRHILGMRVDYTSYRAATVQILDWAKSHASRYVCVATVNNVMEAYDSRDFQRVMNGADLVTPDGMPLVWGLKLLGVRNAVRVYGPDLTPILLEAASRASVPVGFYGGAPHVLRALVSKAKTSFPEIDVRYAYSPPFRELTADEENAIVADINASGVRLLFIGLNSPKQDVWMAKHRGRVQSVMIGVGAAFDFFTGSKPQAPRWMMSSGLEWLFRLVTEPRRLWRRYLRHNPRFLALFAAQLLRLRRFDAQEPTSQSAQPV